MYLMPVGRRKFWGDKRMEIKERKAIKEFPRREGRSHRSFVVRDVWDMIKG